MAQSFWLILFQILFQIWVLPQAWAQNDESLNVQDVSVLKANPDEKLHDIVGPPLPKNLSFLKVPTANRQARTMNFDFLQSGGKLVPAKFVYECSENELQIGPVGFFAQHLVIEHKSRGKKNDLIFKWPANLPQTGKIEIKNARTEKIIWEQNFEPSDLGKELKLVKENNKPMLFEWKKEDISSKFLNNLQIRDGIRYCTKFAGDNYQHELCSGRLKSKLVENQLIWQASEKKELKVTLNGKPVLPNGIVVLGEAEDPIELAVQWPGGSRMRLKTQPMAFEIIDAYRSPKNAFILRAKGARPYEDKVKFFNDGSWEIKVKNFRFFVMGAGGIPFLQELLVSQQLPSQDEKPKIYSQSLLNTYSESKTIYGFVPKTAKLESMDGQAQKYESTFYSWQVNELKLGETNKKFIGITYGDRSYVGAVNIYRGYHMELSTRLTGVALASQGILIFSDLMWTYWFEDLFNLKHFWLSQQRWGFKFKYFNQLTSTTSLSQFSGLQLDLNYRLTPGIKDHDTTVGLILGYQNLTVNTDTISVIGSGFFWERSMPPFFDKLFNIIPWFRHPKWVDMELIYYFASTNNDYQLKTNFSLNLHGKMFITSQLFIEAGVAARQIQAQRVDSGLSLLNAQYLSGTIGVGYNF